MIAAAHIARAQGCGGANLAQTRPSPHLTAIVKRFWRHIETNPAARAILIGLGVLLMAASPIVGPIPGPGGVIVFAAGLTLVLKYSGWAKRLYVRLKRKHPKKGEWADWGLRRRSALRRHARRKAVSAEQQLADD